VNPLSYFRLLLSISTANWFGFETMETNVSRNQEFPRELLKKQATFGFLYYNADYRIRSSDTSTMLLGHLRAKQSERTLSFSTAFVH
jgi:hypothetical protein